MFSVEKEAGFDETLELFSQLREFGMVNHVIGSIGKHIYVSWYAPC